MRVLDLMRQNNNCPICDGSLEYSIRVIDNFDGNGNYTYNRFQLYMDKYPLTFTKKIDIAPDRSVTIEKCNCCEEDIVDLKITSHINLIAKCISCDYVRFYNGTYGKSKGHDTYCYVINTSVNYELILGFSNNTYRIYNYLQNEKYTSLYRTGKELSGVNITLQSYKELKDLIKNPSEIQKIIDYSSLLS